MQELRTLGKGGYGLVVAAVNRLDGRQYAVKKIRMPSAAPVAYSRLMREVSTLARLQHPHVVRYFQVTSLPSSWQSDVSSRMSCKFKNYSASLLLLNLLHCWHPAYVQQGHPDTLRTYSVPSFLRPVIAIP